MFFKRKEGDGLDSGTSDSTKMGDKNNRMVLLAPPREQLFHPYGYAGDYGGYPIKTVYSGYNTGPYPSKLRPTQPLPYPDS